MSATATRKYHLPTRRRRRCGGRSTSICAADGGPRLTQVDNSLPPLPGGRSGLRRVRLERQGYSWHNAPVGLRVALAQIARVVRVFTTPGRAGDGTAG